MQRGKIFGIGYPKTATSSLAGALEVLGYRSVHDPYDILPLFFPDELPKVAHDPLVIEQNDALSGLVCLVYEELDVTRPGSKFILTVRDEQKWLASVRAHLKNNETTEGRAMDAEQPLRAFARGKLYDGDIWYDEAHSEHYLELYRDFNRRVQEYFRGRDDLLVMNIEQGDGWEKLCAFLGCAVPDKPLPWKNRRTWRRTLRRAVKRWKKKVGLRRQLN